MSRRELREHIFRILFRGEFYQGQEELSEQTKLYLEILEGTGVPEDEEEEKMTSLPTPEEEVYISGKANRIFGCIEELDEKINGVAEGWKTKRMSKVDLTIIRLALYEILFDEDVPEKVAINEAVELAKKFGGNESPSFVNGILARLVRNQVN